MQTTSRAATLTVAPGGDLQAAINAAQPGDTVILQAGASYTGGFRLPNKVGDAYVTIRTSTPDTELPEGRRVTPADSGKMAKIVTPGSGMPAISTEAGAHHYRLIGLEIMPASAQSVVYEVVSLGSAGADQDTLDEVPHHITIDRCFIHGWPDANFKRGIGLNSSHTEILNSHVSDFHSDFQDSQAIGGFNGPGPFKIINNRLEGAAENIMFGGATPAIRGLVPSNVEIRRNHLYKPRSWKPGEPGSTSYKPWVKNLFEIKSGQDFVIDGNVMENNWYQADQHGTAIVLTPRSEWGAAPWAVVQRVTFTNNRVVNVGGGVLILGKDDGVPNDVETNDITFRNNLFQNVRNDYSVDGSRVIQVVGASRVTFDHNTVLHANNLLRGYGELTGDFVYTNNITHYGGANTGVWTDCGMNQAGLNCHFPGNTFLKNAVIGAPSGIFSSPNFYPAGEGAVGFVDYAAGDYRLGATSPYKNAGTDGKDVGADIDAIEAAYRATGPSATPNPTPSPTPTPSLVSTPTPTPTPAPVPPPDGDVVWVEDAPPAGGVLAGDGEGWNWSGANPAPYSGTLSHQSNSEAGVHQHYFHGASAQLQVAAGDKLFAYVYLDPANTPSEVMLQWNDGSWEHRAYWGANNIAWGSDGTGSRRYMGALPPAGRWVRLEVPANQVGLEGRTLSGMAFTLFGGRAAWDRAGKSTQQAPPTPTPSPTPTPPPAPNVAPAVSLTSPAEGAAFAAPADITITAAASDGDGAIAKVEFFQGATKLGDGATAGNGSYSFTWRGMPAGSYTLTARATDDAGATATSGAVGVSVRSAGDFSLSASPSSRTIRRGGQTSYTVAAAPSGGFTGVVTLDVSGALPSGVAVSFSPQSVTSSGSSTMTVSTSSATPTGTHVLAVRGTSGSLQQITSVTLSVRK